MEILSDDIQADLAAAHARTRRKAARLRVEADGVSHLILRMDTSGFVIAADHDPMLRGLVDIFDGSRHRYQCLIVASRLNDGEVAYDFKRLTAATDTPAPDFVQDLVKVLAQITSQG